VPGLTDPAKAPSMMQMDDKGGAPMKNDGMDGKMAP
jgi:hypothetical protein